MTVSLGVAAETDAAMPIPVVLSNPPGAGPPITSTAGLRPIVSSTGGSQ